MIGNQLRFDGGTRCIIALRLDPRVCVACVQDRITQCVLIPQSTLALRSKCRGDE